MMSPYDGNWYRWEDLPQGPATTERIRQHYNWLTEAQLATGEYQYNESPNGFGWNRREPEEVETDRDYEERMTQAEQRADAMTDAEMETALAGFSDYCCERNEAHERDGRKSPAPLGASVYTHPEWVAAQIRQRQQRQGA